MDDSTDRWLKEMRDTDQIAPCTYAFALFVHHYHRTLGLPEPAGAVMERAVEFFWDKGHHHYSVRVRPDDTTEWFYRDRRDEGLWYDEAVGRGVPAQATTCANLLKEK